MANICDFVTCKALTLDWQSDFDYKASLVCLACKKLGGGTLNYC